MARETAKIYLEHYHEIIDTADSVAVTEALIISYIESFADRYTIYRSAPEYAEYDTEMSGTYYGIGVLVTRSEDDVITVKRDGGQLSPVNIKTLPYPGFPTDMHPQFTAILATANGTAKVHEGVWDNRFRYVDQLRKMGADITVEGRTATVVGTDRLHGAPTSSVDLRGGAALVIAALAAEGTTYIENIQTLKRGYDSLVAKLKGVGADIEIVEKREDD